MSRGDVFSSISFLIIYVTIWYSLVKDVKSNQNIAFENFWISASYHINRYLSKKISCLVNKTNYSMNNKKIKLISYSL